jgi:hypothetical protein
MSRSQSEQVPPSSPPPIVTIEDTDGNNSNASILPEDILEDLPPAYTPTPDVHQGEYTMERGPRRPFQPTAAGGVGAGAPPRHPSNASLFSRPGATVASSSYRPAIPTETRPRSNFTGSSNNSNWSAYPGAHRSTASLGSNNILVVPPPPPQQRPSSANANTNTGANASRPMSEFARDFYAAGAADTSSLSQGTSPGGSNSGSTSPHTNRYAPPPGSPPRLAGWPASDGRATQPQSNHTIPDDGRPTTTPMPGHPLLKNGRLLVYTGGYECPRCRYYTLLVYAFYCLLITYYSNTSC